MSAFLIREYQKFHSNYRATSSLAEYLKAGGVLGIDQIDTRALTRHIRTAGAMRAFLSTEDLDPQSLVNRAKQIPSMVGQDLAGVVTAPRPYFWIDGKPSFPENDTPLDKTIWKQRPMLANRKMKNPKNKRNRWNVYVGGIPQSMGLWNLKN